MIINVKRVQIMVLEGSCSISSAIIVCKEAYAGQRLLERYGMTETGMLLSNKYKGERKPGFVGYPLPGVSVALKDDGKLSAFRAVLIQQLELATQCLSSEHLARTKGILRTLATF